MTSFAPSRYSALDLRFGLRRRAHPAPIQQSDKPVTDSEKATSDKGGLVRAIGFLGVAVLAINSVIGGGIFGLPAVVVERAGIAAPWLFLFVSVLVIAIVLTFAELASYFRESGGPVLFATRAFGPFVGFGTGWIYYISRIAAFAANANLLATYLGTVYAPLGFGDMPS